MVGHSIGNGVGATDTVYGGAALPAGVSLRDGGSNRTTWPSNAGTGPDPGVLPYLAAYALADGAPSVQIIRRTTNGQIVAGIQTTQLLDAINDQFALGCADPDLVVAMIGENDAQDSTESGAYTTRLPVVLELIEARWPSCRIVVQDMATQNGSYSEYPAIRAANAAAVALRATRALSSYAGITFNDAVHYDLQGYQRAGSNIWDAWASTD